MLFLQQGGMLSEASRVFYNSSSYNHLVASAGQDRETGNWLNVSSPAPSQELRR